MQRHAGIEVVAEMYERGFSARSIQNMIGFNNQVRVLRWLRKAGVAIRKSHGHIFHKQYRGGRIPATDGYWKIKVSDGDPMVSMRNKAGYVLEHRLIMARKIGRPLLRSETVHHKDLDHGNNADGNLQLRQGKHGKGTVMCCLECGSLKIGFKDLD